MPKQKKANPAQPELMSLIERLRETTTKFLEVPHCQQRLEQLITMSETAETIVNEYGNQLQEGNQLHLFKHLARLIGYVHLPLSLAFSNACIISPQQAALTKHQVIHTIQGSTSLWHGFTRYLDHLCKNNIQHKLNTKTKEELLSTLSTLLGKLQLMTVAHHRSTVFKKNKMWGSPMQPSGTLLINTVSERTNTLRFIAALGEILSKWPKAALQDPTLQTIIKIRHAFYHPETPKRHDFIQELIGTATDDESCQKARIELSNLLILAPRAINAMLGLCTSTFILINPPDTLAKHTPPTDLITSLTLLPCPKKKPSQGEKPPTSNLLLASLRSLRKSQKKVRNTLEDIPSNIIGLFGLTRLTPMQCAKMEQEFQVIMAASIARNTSAKNPAVIGCCQQLSESRNNYAHGQPSQDVSDEVVRNAIVALRGGG